MGVQFGDLVEPRKISLDELKGRSVAFDGHKILYQFLAIIRGQAGEPLKDSQGYITSHLSGLIYRNSNLMEAGVRVVSASTASHTSTRGRLSKRATRYASRLSKSMRKRWRRATRREFVAGGSSQSLLPPTS